MKLSQHHTCHGCRALRVGFRRCALGYGTEIRRIDDHGYGVQYIPSGPCPKPTTLAELEQARNVSQDVSVNAP